MSREIFPSLVDYDEDKWDVRLNREGVTIDELEDCSKAMELWMSINKGKMSDPDGVENIKNMIDQKVKDWWEERTTYPSME